MGRFKLRHHTNSGQEIIHYHSTVTREQDGDSRVEKSSQIATVLRIQETTLAT